MLQIEEVHYVTVQLCMMKQFVVEFVSGWYWLAGSDGKPLCQAEMFDPAVNTWTALTNMSVPICSCSFMTFNGRLHVIGGLTVGGPSASLQVLSLNWLLAVFLCFLISLCCVSCSWCLSLNSDFFSCTVIVMQGLLAVPGAVDSWTEIAWRIRWKIIRMVLCWLYNIVVHIAILRRDSWFSWAVILPVGLHKVQPCRYCFYSEVQKWVFLPHRGDTFPR